jgi:hypothetical protein
MARPQQDRHLHGNAKETPEAVVAAPGTWRQRLLVSCYLTAITVAMFGWLSAFGWAATEIARLRLT